MKFCRGSVCMRVRSGGVGEDIVFSYDGYR